MTKYKVFWRDGKEKGEIHSKEIPLKACFDSDFVLELSAVCICVLSLEISEIWRALRENRGRESLKREMTMEEKRWRKEKAQKPPSSRSRSPSFVLWLSFPQTAPSVDRLNWRR